MDIGIPVFMEFNPCYALNYYIYEPDEEIFIRVPIADEKGIALAWEKKSFDERFYMMSVVYGETKLEGTYTLWQWNESEIEKFAEVYFSFADCSEENWEASVTGYDQNGDITGEWNFSSNINIWDDVWKRAEEEMHIYNTVDMRIGDFYVELDDMRET